MAEWAKLHTDILGDPKLMRAARRGHSGLVYLPWLIAFAKRADDDGRLTVDGAPVELADLVAVIPGAGPKGLAKAIQSLISLRILVAEDPPADPSAMASPTDQTLRFLNWDSRQTPPSSARDAIRERVKQHRARRKAKKDTKVVTTGNEVGNNVTVTSCNETEGEGEEERKNPPNTSPPEPRSLPPGIVAPNGATPEPAPEPGVALLRKSAAPLTPAQIVAELQAFRGLALAELRREQAETVVVKVGFSYWATLLKHEDCLLDPKRAGYIRKRYRESRDPNEILFVVDGARKDDHLMAREANSTRRYDGISTLYRDREQVERLARLGGYRPGRIHPIAKKYLGLEAPTGGASQ